MNTDTVLDPGGSYPGTRPTLGKHRGKPRRRTATRETTGHYDEDGSANTAMTVGRAGPVASNNGALARPGDDKTKPMTTKKMMLTATSTTKMTEPRIPLPSPSLPHSYPHPIPSHSLLPYYRPPLPVPHHTPSPSPSPSLTKATPPLLSPSHPPPPPSPPPPSVPLPLPFPCLPPPPPPSPYVISPSTLSSLAPSPWQTRCRGSSSSERQTTKRFKD